MTIEDKLQHFMDVSVNGAHEKGQQMLDEYKTSIDKLYEQHKAEALNTANTYIKTTKRGIKRNISKDYAQQQLNIKRQLIDKQEEIMEKIFIEVIELLNNFKSTPEYTSLLLKHIKDSLEIAGNNPIDIFIDPEDSDKLTILEEKSKCKININDKPFMGGIKAIIPSKNIIIDNSFESKYSLEKENFVIDL